MEFYEELLLKQLSPEILNQIFKNMHFDLNAILHDACYYALREIKKVLEDDSLEDAECFEKIEQIVSILEKYGSDAGTRHDFG